MSEPESADTEWRAFAALHAPALERNEARHNVILGVLDAAHKGDIPPPRTWTLGAPGQCALQSPRRPLALGELTKAQSERLAEQLPDANYPAVFGTEGAAQHFAARATALGVRFAEPMAQMVQALTEPPRYPGAPGSVRTVLEADAPLVLEWMTAFQVEALPYDAPPNPQRLREVVASGRFRFWIVNGEPVAVASIARSSRNSTAISAVYTPPAHRGRGYAGSVVAAIVDIIRSRGKTIACLHTDLSNPYSNRCYAKIGFKPVCAAWHFPRLREAVPARAPDLVQAAALQR